MTASAGSPWTDVARTSLILSIGAKAARKQVRPIIRVAIKVYHRTYLNRYRALTQVPRAAETNQIIPDTICPTEPRWKTDRISR